ncbi:MAG: exodeoxyribonuclease VII small subunit [Spirochaetia bacterium]|nr:exodeoxyribonuclease VII small subunit [Spirochaetia bacterium]
MDWEKKLERMGEITSLLKDEKTSLEASITLLEEGVAISKEVENHLNEAQRKVEKIINSIDDEENELETTPFTHTSVDE